MFPEQAHLLALSEDVFKVELVLNVLTDNADSKCVVHGFIEEVTEELDDVWMVLSLEQLNSFFFILVQLI